VSGVNGQSIPVEFVAETVGDGLGAGVRNGTAELRPVTVPGVDRSVVWLVRDDHLDHPLQAYVGYWPGGEVRLLSDDQDAWAELMDAAGPHIADAATALGYVRQFLECTRGPSVIVQEVTGPQDLHWRPGSVDEEQRRAAFSAGPAIAGPVVDRGDNGFRVELTLVVGQRVQRNLFDVTPEGRITASFQVIAEDLPLPISR